MTSISAMEGGLLALTTRVDASRDRAHRRKHSDSTFSISRARSRGSIEDGIDATNKCTAEHHAVWGRRSRCHSDVKKIESTDLERTPVFSAIRADGTKNRTEPRLRGLPLEFENSGWRRPSSRWRGRCQGPGRLGLHASPTLPKFSYSDAHGPLSPSKKYCPPKPLMGDGTLNWRPGLL